MGRVSLSSRAGGRLGAAAGVSGIPVEEGSLVFLRGGGQQCDGGVLVVPSLLLLWCCLVVARLLLLLLLLCQFLLVVLLPLSLSLLFYACGCSGWPLSLLLWVLAVVVFAVVAVIAVLIVGSGSRAQIRCCAHRPSSDRCRFPRHASVAAVLASVFAGMMVQQSMSLFDLVGVPVFRTASAQLCIAILSPSYQSCIPACVCLRELSLYCVAVFVGGERSSEHIPGGGSPRSQRDSSFEGRADLWLEEFIARLRAPGAFFAHVAPPALQLWKCADESWEDFWSRSTRYVERVEAYAKSPRCHAVLHHRGASRATRLVSTSRSQRGSRQPSCRGDFPGGGKRYVACIGEHPTQPGADSDAACEANKAGEGTRRSSGLACGNAPRLASPQQLARDCGRSLYMKIPRTLLC